MSRLCGQTYPTTLMAGMNSGGSLYPDEWADPVVKPVQLTVWLNDFSVPSWDVKIHFELRNSNGLLLQSNPNGLWQSPINVVPGVPLLLEGNALSDLFNYNNLLFEGISRTTLENNQRLAEGLYVFCFTVVDFKTGRTLSKQVCWQQQLTLLNPPTIVWPTCGSQVNAGTSQNIPFQWQFNGTSPQTATQLVSEITLYEVVGNWADPQSALFNQQVLPIWKSDVLTPTQLLYNGAFPSLEMGKRYVFTVKASDGSNRVRFKNNGLSPPCWFQYGCFLNDTISCIAPHDSAQLTLRTTPTFSWKRPTHAMAQEQLVYEIKIVPVLSGQTATAALTANAPFYDQLYLPTANATVSKTIPVSIWANCVPMQAYAWQITAHACNQKVAVSAPRVFIGPPPLDGILAAGFYCPIIRVAAFDKYTGVLTATCSAEWPVQEQKASFEFAVKQVTVAPLGDNTWQLINGEARGKCPPLTATLQPNSLTNSVSTFVMDSFNLQPTALHLGGQIKTPFTLATKLPAPPLLVFRRNWLVLSPSHHWLSGNALQLLEKDQEYGLKELNDFRLQVAATTSCMVYQNKVSFFYSGCIITPDNVLSASGQRPRFCFTNQSTLELMVDSLKGESCLLNEGIKLALTPLTYTFVGSSASFSNTLQPLKKGVFFDCIELTGEEWPDIKGQWHWRGASKKPLRLLLKDGAYGYIDERGLSLKTAVQWPTDDTTYFNTFLCRAVNLAIDVQGATINSASLKGQLLIPFIDTVNWFSWQCDLDEEGFREGYLDKALSGISFTFNGKGGQEQTVLFVIQQAQFTQRNAIVMNVTANWPWLNTGAMPLSGLMVWGNGDIGFGAPNNTVQLQQAVATKMMGYPFLITHVGCGRTGKVYGFGVSGEAVIDEEMSGELGPPSLHLYSVYGNGKGFLNGDAPADSITSSSATVQTAAQLLHQSNVLFTMPGFNKGDTGVMVVNRPTTTASVQLVASKIVQSLRQLSEFIVKVKPLLKPDALSPAEWRVLAAFSSALESETAWQIQQAGTAQIINFFLNKLVEALADKATQPIRKLADKAVGGIRKTANQYIYEPVKGYTDKVLEACFTHLQRQLIAATNASLEPVIHQVLNEIKTQLTATIYFSVQGAFEKEAIAPLCDFIANAVGARAVNEIRGTVIQATTKLMNNGWKGDLDFGLFAKDALTALQPVSDTVVNSIMRLNATDFVTIGQRIAADIIKDLNWQAIAEEVLAQLLSKGISNALANQLAVLLPQSAGPFVSSALSAIKFDFTNLDQKIKKGELNKVVTADPTNIYIESPAADIRGQLKLFRNDAIYGDCFKANVMVRLKVPKKDNPIECNAAFVSGKTEQASSRFSYWFASLAVSGLNVSVTPVPVIWDGVEGHVFKHMRLSNNQMVPDITNKFGVGCKFYFYDLPTSGKTWLMTAGLDVVFNDKGFNTELAVDASLLNFRKAGSRYVAPGLISGKGTLGYYKDNVSAHFAGNIMAKLNTEPILCMGGQVGFDLESPQKWSFWLGTKSSPIGYKVLCKDNFQHTGYFILRNDGMELQLKKWIQFSAASGWLNVSGVKIKGAVAFATGYELTTALEWEPQFAIKDATFELKAAGSLVLTVDASGVQTVYNVASADFTGNLQLKSQPDMELHGNVTANISVLQYTFNFTTDVNYNLSTQQIIIK